MQLVIIMVMMLLNSDPGPETNQMSRPSRLREQNPGGTVVWVGIVWIRWKRVKIPQMTRA